MSGQWLAFGLSGQVGDAVRARLGPLSPPLLAYSRTPRTDTPGIHWQQGGLDESTPPTGRVDVVLSLGPLDLFARWFERSALAPARIVALGSTSVHSKPDSPDAGERALAQRLSGAEAQLRRVAGERGAAVALLRPTLIYGNGRDRSLSRLVALARRLPVLPLPRGAHGLRQPVHVEDIAFAVLACARAATALDGAFDLPGGEALSFREMVRRTLRAAAPATRVVVLPDPVFALGVRAGRWLGWLPEGGEGMLSRLDRDLLADPGPARSAFGYAPRTFAPRAEMFAADGAPQHTPA